MIQKLARWLEYRWYQQPVKFDFLKPLGQIYCAVASVRRFLYIRNFIHRVKLPVPVIIVGNLTVGGTGKTPLITYLAEKLTESGFNPGIISRGYGGKSETWPVSVYADSDTELVGDEPLLLARRTNCPIVVGPDRVSAAQQLLNRHRCDLILSDDGMQHYRLNRDIEIAVVDGHRFLGNEQCLPAGPLREPVSRLASVDYIVGNGQAYQSNAKNFAMTVAGDTAVNLATGVNKPLIQFANQKCHAVAGIGNPDRFFKMLSQYEMDLICHPFPDHYAFQPESLDFGSETVLMTEKDAVKCSKFVNENMWFIPVRTVMEPKFFEIILTTLREKKNG